MWKDFKLKKEEVGNGGCGDAVLKFTSCGQLMAASHENCAKININRWV